MGWAGLEVSIRLAAGFSWELLSAGPVVKAGALVLKSIGIWIAVGSVSVWGTTFHTLSQCYLKTNYRHMCHGICIEVRGQLLGVASFVSPPCMFRGLNSVLGSMHLTH